MSATAQIAETQTVALAVTPLGDRTSWLDQDVRLPYVRLSKSHLDHGQDAVLKKLQSSVRPVAGYMKVYLHLSMRPCMPVHVFLNAGWYVYVRAHTHIYI